MNGQAHFNDLLLSFPSMDGLSNRVKEAIDDAKRRGITVAQIAKACDVTVQSVYQWMKAGERKELDGSHLVELAHITGFECRWMMNNKGPKKRPPSAQTGFQESVLEIMQRENVDQATIERIVIAASPRTKTGTNE